jgi:hypothetical protein
MTKIYKSRKGKEKQITDALFRLNIGNLKTTSKLKKRKGGKKSRILTIFEGILAGGRKKDKMRSSIFYF